jgi:F-type H+-transporting ATPase subunit b
MNFNATLLGQMFAFGVFWYFCYKMVWPGIMGAMEERKTKIADGLAAAEKGQKDLELAEGKAKELLVEGKEQSKEIIATAQKRHDEIVEEAKDNARSEGERILVAARAEIDQERQTAREALRQQVAELAVAGAEQILMREVDQAAHKEVLDKVSASL